MIKHSKQRDAIYEFLKTRHDHPTAETVYRNLREQYPQISLGTVYRNLSLLSELGEIKKISTGQGPDRFDATTTPHNHFFCNKCNSLLDIEMDSISHVNEIAGKNFQGEILGHSIYFYGVCPKCLQQAT